jgi:AhpD family alkylhydroperoxidase
MKPRLDYAAAAPQVMKGMYELEKQVKASGLEQSLIELVKMRASQINGCAFCLHMHSRDARAAGETEERLYLLDAWRESPLYTDRERAALAWTESLTLISQTHAPDADYEVMAGHFAPDEQVKLTLLICAINAWNRIAIGFRSVHPVDAGRPATKVAASQ